MATEAVPARLLDLTRLVSRLARGPMTGIDRVESAYLTELLNRQGPLFGLVKTGAGFLLLDSAGVRAVADLVAGENLGPTDWLSRMTYRSNPLRGQAEATVRRLAIARAAEPWLGRMLHRTPIGTHYLNVGHSNLSLRTLACLRSRCRIIVLLHDTIPLDHPGLSRPGTIESFRRKVAAVAEHADLVIHTTDATRLQTEVHLREAGRLPPGIVARLGVPAPQPIRTLSGPVPTAPYFLVLGTVEPRKNHALLLRVWQDLAKHGPPPRLVVAGARGWAAPQVFDGLARTPGVTLQSGLSDVDVAALLHGATALLFPSLAEGFGLPPVEAAALGTPVIASDLPVLREVLGDYPVYLAAADTYSWTRTVKTFSSQQVSNRRLSSRPPPSWTDHFNTVLNVA